jgi:hypothetical protein
LPRGNRKPLRQGNLAPFDLTMPAHDLMELLQRPHGEAERVLLESITERESREEDAATNERFRLGYDACEELLVDLDPRS